MNYILFKGVNDAIFAQKSLEENNIKARLVPVPEKLKKGCGFCIITEDLDGVLKILDNFEGVYDGNFKKIDIS